MALSGIASYLVDLTPKWLEYLNKDVSMPDVLKKALYGCIESAKLFHNHVCEKLMFIGFIRNPYDSCILNNVGERVGIKSL
jgi:hypothetical protein